MQDKAPYAVWVQFQDELWMIDLVKGFWKIQQYKSVCLPWLDLRAKSSAKEANCVSQERLSQSEVSFFFLRNCILHK